MFDWLETISIVHVLILVVSLIAISYGVVTVRRLIIERADRKYSHLLAVSPFHPSIERLRIDNGISWDLAFFLLDITKGYEHGVFTTTLDEEKSTKHIAYVHFHADVTSSVNVENIERKLTMLAKFIGATGSKVLDSDATDLSVAFRFTNKNFMTTTVPWTVDHRDHPETPFAAPMGMDETGVEVITQILGGHTLIGGHSGYGKGAVLWNMLGVMTGRDEVRIFGVDLKGGMEFKMNPGVFESVAVEEEDFVATVDLVHQIVEQRNRRFAGKTQKVQPSAKTPMIVLVIDEAADIADIAKDKEYDGFLTQLKQILRKGRAVGVVVIAALQDPNKSAFPLAHLFPTRIATKLDPGQQNAFLPNTRHIIKLDKLGKNHRGVCLMKTENGEPVIIKAYFPDHDTIQSLPGRVKK